MDEGGSYFVLDPRAEGEGPGRFVDVTLDVQPIRYTAGLEFRPVVGTNLMVSFVRYEPHTEAPLHTHDEEQITFVIDGQFEFDLAGERRIMSAGQAVVVPPNVPHGARTLDSSCLEADVFSPPREALLELMREQTSGP